MKFSRFRIFVHYLYLDYCEEHRLYSPFTTTLSVDEWFKSYKYFIKQRYREKLAREQHRLEWLEMTDVPK